MKIVFWGTPKYAAENLEAIIESGYEVVAVVTQPDRKRGRGKKLSPSPVKLIATHFDIPVFTTNSISKDDITRKSLCNLNADIYIVVAFGQILPREILDQPKFGCWNSHASLLPKWRGAAPIQWSIINDDSKTGVCIMAMQEGLDTGPVIEQESTEITDSDNLEILTNRLSKISSKLLLRSIEKLKKTKGLSEKSRLNILKAIEQTKLNGEISYARQIKKEDYLIDWNQNSRIILKKIQGLYPNAYTLFDGRRIKILDAIPLCNKDQSIPKIIKNIESLIDITPGEVLMIDKQNGIIIMTNDLPILIKYAQLEGKTKTDGYTLSVQSKLSIRNKLGY